MELKEENNKLVEDLYKHNCKNTETIKENTAKYIKIFKETTDILIKPTPKERDTKMTDETKSLLIQRGNAIEKKNLIAYEMLNKRFRKNIRENQTKTITYTLENSINIRDKWLGIRQLKSEYQTNTYARRTKEGNYIPQAQRAQKNS